MCNGVTHAFLFQLLVSFICTVKGIYIVSYTSFHSST